VVARRGGLDEDAHLRAAGKRNEIDARMLRECASRNATEARHNVDRPFGEADLRRHLGDAQGREARLLRRLDNRRIADSERRSQRAAKHLGRIVPGDDVAGHTMRDAFRGDEIALEKGDRLAMEFVSRAAVELEVARKRRDVGARLLHRLAGVARLEAGKILCSREHSISEADEEPSALGRGEAPPRARFIGPARGLHGLVDIRRVARGDLSEGPALGGRDDIDGAATLAWLPLIVDEDALGGLEAGGFAFLGGGGNTHGTVLRQQPGRRSRHARW
jgi:hypothetical protein